MKIEDYDRKLAEEISYGLPIISGSHVICGFKISPEIDERRLKKGEFNDCLEWPFYKLVSFVLIHQDNKDKHHKSILTKPQERVKNVNTGWGDSKFITLEKLDASGFIKSNILYIRCNVC